MRRTYQRRSSQSKHHFAVIGRKELAVEWPLRLVEVWEQLQPEVEHLTGMAGLQIIRAVIEDEVTRRVGPRYRAGPGVELRALGTATGLCSNWRAESGGGTDLPPEN